MMIRKGIGIVLLLMFWQASFSQCKSDNGKAIAVVERTISLLEHPDNWHKNDERVCTDDEANKSYSLYCALYASQIELVGEYKHRGKVMKAVRKAIKQRSDQRFKHPIRDYNNLEGVSHADITDLLNSVILTFE